MAREQSSSGQLRANLAVIVLQVARTSGAETIICVTETGALFHDVCKNTCEVRVIGATPNRSTYEALHRDGHQAVQLSLRLADKYGQARHAVSTALHAGKVSPGSLIVCGIGHGLCHGQGDLVFVTNVDADIADIDLSEMIKLTDGIRPVVMEAALQVACKIGRVVRRGKRVGALFTLGDTDKVLKDSKQMILNPFQGHEGQDRFVTNPDIHGMLVELAKLDGAFVVRGDGFIRTAAAFLATPETDIDLPAGLGARHIAAAAVTAKSHATAIVVSATDGFVRAFSGGKLVLQMDPDVPFGPGLPGTIG